MVEQVYISMIGSKELQMENLKDFLTFRMMVSPVALQVLFWAGIGGTFYGAYLLFTLDHWAWWMALVFGSLLTRVIFEFAMLSFRSYDRLGEIAVALDSLVKKID
jgi:hypothetical protein